MLDQDAYIYIALLTCAILTGMAKTGLPALGSASAVLLTVVFPNKTAMGILLPILIMGDLISVCVFSRHAQIGELLRIAPFVIIGLIAGSFALNAIQQTHFRYILALLIGIMLALDYLKRRKAKDIENYSSPTLRSITGIGSGIVTTIGNAAGPIMALYFLLMGLQKNAYIGTAAWFFLIVNIIKIPIYTHIDVMSTETLKLSAVAIPFVGIGSYIGIQMVKRIPIETFRKMIIWMTAISLIWLLAG